MQIEMPEACEVVETFTVPEIFVTHWPKAEPCGAGNLMFYGCIKKGLIYEARVCIITPAAHVFAACSFAERAAADCLSAAPATPKVRLAS